MPARAARGSLLLLVAAISLGSIASRPVEDEAAVSAAESAGKLSALASLSEKRASHTATSLAGGRVLIAGGFAAEGRHHASTDLFDPASGTFTRAADMNAARDSHTATRLADDRVLFAGGFDGSYLDAAELYDPATGRFQATGRLVGARSGHVAARLEDGRVLLAGGVGTGWTFLASAEIYDPKTEAFEATGSMTAKRESHTVTRLADGRVLITGGHEGRRTAIRIHRSSEIFEPASGRFVAGPELAIRRHKHDAVLLDDGRVLVVGGSDERDGDGAYRNAEILDLTSGRSIEVAGEMSSARYKLQGTALRLASGLVLIAGGADRIETFDPVSGRFSPAEGDFGSKRLFATATLLDTGEVLITGGYGGAPVASAGAWIWRD